MAEQKTKARAAWTGSGEKASDSRWFDIAEESGSTEFTGYLASDGEAQVVALVKDGQRVDSATAGDTVEGVVNQTPFYGERGGKVGDAGVTKDDGGFRESVAGTAKPLCRSYAHRGTTQNGGLRYGECFSQEESRNGE